MATSCSRCGAAAGESDGDSMPLGWSTSTTERGITAICAGCTREHVRDIEAKLDEPWWA